MKIRQRNAVRNDINSICGIIIIFLGLPLYHLGIGDDAAGAAGKERPLQLEGILVFGNAANEVCVEAFLAGRLSFPRSSRPSRACSQTTRSGTSGPSRMLSMRRRGPETGRAP